jgi:hypothetical protein
MRSGRTSHTGYFHILSLLFIGLSFIILHLSIGNPPQSHRATIKHSRQPLTRHPRQPRHPRHSSLSKEAHSHHNHGISPISPLKRGAHGISANGKLRHCQPQSTRHPRQPRHLRHTFVCSSVPSPSLSSCRQEEVLARVREPSWLRPPSYLLRWATVVNSR